MGRLTLNVLLSLYAFTIVNWANFVKIDLKTYPNIVTYMSRIGGRPKMLEALKAEGLAK
jgi:glutathione S-transferase